ncbi:MULTISPECIES: Crp/Fnr family transcriptional regulator [unclassified Helicobacter]|uniref:Crp/Fnr family transcriptional regulator n=1 Tax=unclassified Helicobacter TaxID=2593540 RepID=UPI000CF17A1C|nr:MULTISPECIES: Crp/Fnr family transcriptional regulator [unclassified Helicobacter]
MYFSKEILDFFMTIGKVYLYKKDRILFFEGQKSKDLYILLKGQIRLYKTDDQGGVINIHFLKSPNFVAEMPVFEGVSYPASACFESDSEVLKIDFKKFKDHLFENQDICMLFIKSLMAKIKFLESMINQNFMMNVELRLAQFLLNHQDKLLFITQKEIAKNINTTPETLSRTLKKMKHQKIIDTHKGKIKILNPKALRGFYADN